MGFEVKKAKCKSCKWLGTVCLTAHPDDEICDEDFEPDPKYYEEEE